MGDGFHELEVRLGYSFREPRLLRTALTHKSRAFEQSNGDPGPDAHNERMEFLGDAVLGFLVSESLFERFPDLPEGRLSKLKARLVSSRHLSEVAARLDLGAHLLLGKGEELSGGREKKALLANALEALIAAIHLDSGLDAVRAFVNANIVADFAAAGIEKTRDFKSALQETAQARKLPLPTYEVVECAGPDHAAIFTVEARVGDEWRERGRGGTKKSAGQHAARLLLERLEQAQP